VATRSAERNSANASSSDRADRSLISHQPMTRGNAASSAEEHSRASTRVKLAALAVSQSRRNKPLDPSPPPLVALPPRSCRCRKIDGGSRNRHLSAALLRVYEAGSLPGESILIVRDSPGKILGGSFLQSRFSSISPVFQCATNTNACPPPTLTFR